MLLPRSYSFNFSTICLLFPTFPFPLNTCPAIRLFSYQTFHYIKEYMFMIRTKLKFVVKSSHVGAEAIPFIMWNSSVTIVINL